jgi:hypothetical protein
MSPKRREIDPQEAAQEFEKVDWEEIKQDVPVKDSEQFYEEQKGEEEEPTPLELAEIRIKQLEDALKKMEQFKPVTALEKVETEYITNENRVFEWLGEREDKVSRYWFPNYGINLFRTRILTDLENRGIKSFKRLYFEV